jgi:NADH-quinone oxidoreductase subunit I/NAD(P)H-quinone oxidoreductase subunit I
MADTAREYAENIKNSVTSIWDGMAVTLSHLFRRPVTVQYPDRTGVHVKYTMAPRYRGFLEVDMDICTGCQACERACPINCIAIDIEKDPANPKQRYMTRFDIDEAKCMYCGLCVEPCPTGAIQHTREFEGSMVNLSNLTFRYVDPAHPAPLYKPPKGVDTYPRVMLGEYVRKLVKQWDAPPPPFPVPGSEKPVEKKKGDDASAAAMAMELAKKALGADKPKLAKILEEAQAGTDCGACTYPTCQEYSEAMASGKETRLHMCEPGGAESAKATQIIMDSWKAGKVVVTPEAQNAKYESP